MSYKPKIYLITRDREFLENLRILSKDFCKIKRIGNIKSLSYVNITNSDLIISDISNSDEKILKAAEKLSGFKIMVFDKYSPENIGELLPYYHFFLSKSVPPSEFMERIKKIRDLMTENINYITYLPGNIDFENFYLNNIQKNLSVAFLDIDNFKFFCAAKGVKKAQEMLRLVSTILRKNIFTSSVKGEVYAYNIFLDRFAIIANKDELTRICSFIYEDFARYKNTLFDNSELTRQFYVMQDRVGQIFDIPVTTLTTVIITRSFDSIIELYRTAEDLFRYLKNKGGNLIFSDRRQMSGQPSEKGIVLIAVYDPLKSNYLKISLERAGWKVFVTNDGITTLKLYNRTRPSLIILDEELPLINYRDITNVLRYELSDNKTVIVYLSEIDDWIDSQYKFSTLSGDLNAEKINNKLIALISQNREVRG